MFRTILKAGAALIAVLALVFATAAASPLPANAASGCKITFSSYHRVKVGSRGAQAKAAQCLLRSAGYQIRTDGSFSAADARKLKRFQRSRELRASGVVNARSWTALLSRGSRPRLDYGDRGASVRRLQRALTASGRPVPATGYFGPMTRAAVRSVQAYQGWRRTGVATTGVWRVLQAGGAVRVSAVRATASTSTSTASSSGTRGAVALAFARRQIGDAYRYGATGPNAWDCSGLTGGAWRAAGVRLPRTSQAQFGVGRRISKSNLRPGDLVFFYSGVSHVALYAGNGKVLHASRPGKPVGYLPMKYMPYVGARRPG